MVPGLFAPGPSARINVSTFQIRCETAADVSAIHAVHTAAFDTRLEADLVDTLRQTAAPIVSLVAGDAGKIFGHILFSPVTLSRQPDAKIMGLAPMAVLPAEQRRGIGSALVREGLTRCQSLGYGAAVVVGHRDYYPRFGFKPATTFNLKCEYDVPDDVFMALELIPNYLQDKSGKIHYHSAFGT
jgi:putative acetyltransferase